MTTEGMEWLDDPSSVNPKDWLSAMALADSKPGDALKRARSALSYFLKTQKHALAPSPPWPLEHVFTDKFFRWLVKKYPAIQGIHPHYRRITLSTTVSIRWSNAKPPGPPPDPLAVLREEKERLKAQIAMLEAEVQRLREIVDRRKTTNKINASRPRKPQ